MLVRSLCIALTSTVVFAQSYSPTHFANAEGPTNNNFPFGVPLTPFRYSQIHDDVPAMVITGMSFRHDYIPNATAGYSLTMDAWMSTAVTASSAMITTFDNNHGPDKTQVIVNRTYTLPPTDPSALPGGFDVDFPFDVPFVFPGSPASLCWEVQITATTNTTYVACDSVSSASSTTTGPTNPAIATGYFGTGCLSTGQVTPMLATPTQSMNWPGATATMTTNGTYLLPNGITVFATGADKTSYLGIPLPFTLPGTTCTVYNDMIVSAIVIASATGTGSNAISFVPQPAYHGLTFYTQIWGLDPNANPFGLTMSNAAMHHIVAPFAVPLPVSRAYLVGSLGPTGSGVTRGYGLITKFY